MGNHLGQTQHKSSQPIFTSTTQVTELLHSQVECPILTSQYMKSLSPAERIVILLTIFGCGITFFGYQIFQTRIERLIAAYNNLALTDAPSLFTPTPIQPVPTSRDITPSLSTTPLPSATDQPTKILEATHSISSTPRLPTRTPRPQRPSPTAPLPTTPPTAAPPPPPPISKSGEMAIPQGPMWSQASSVQISGGCVGFRGSHKSEQDTMQLCNNTSQLEPNYSDTIKWVIIDCTQNPNLVVILWSDAGFTGTKFEVRCSG